jgi:hypothetical protein
MVFDYKTSSSFLNKLITVMNVIKDEDFEEALNQLGNDFGVRKRDGRVKKFR